MQTDDLKRLRKAIEPLEYLLQYPWSDDAMIEVRFGDIKHVIKTIKKLKE